MTNLLPKFKSIVKDRLFYDRYQYCVNFWLQEISCLRDQDLDHGCITKMINRRREWRKIAQQRWTSLNKKGLAKTILSQQRHNDITPLVEQNLHDFADILHNSSADFKLIVSTDYGWIYTNDVALVSALDQSTMLTRKCYTQAVVDRPKDTIRLKNSKYSFRSYFKIIKVTDQQKDMLTNFLNNQQGYVRISPALVEWLSGPFHRTQDYFFVDHSEKSWLTMLSLVRPGIIRKTVQIIPAK